MLKQITPVIRLRILAFGHRPFMARYFFPQQKKNTMNENMSSKKT